MKIINPQTKKNLQILLPEALKGNNLCVNEEGMIDCVK